MEIAEQELKTMVAEILETDPKELCEDSELEEFRSYDSAGRLSLMLGLADFAGRPIMVPELMKLRTYGDVIDLVRSCSRNGQNS